MSEHALIDNASIDELKAMKAEGNYPDPEESPEEEAAPDPQAEMMEKLKQLEKRVSDKELFIQRQANEIGQLRKANQPKISDEELLSNPVENTRKLIMEEIENRAGAGQVPPEDHSAQLKAWIPDYDSYSEEIAGILKADGAPDDVVEMYKKNPSGGLPAMINYQLAKRAQLERKIKELSGKTERVNKAIAQASTNRTPVKSPSASRDGGNITAEDIQNMSYDELLKMRKKLQSR